MDTNTIFNIQFTMSLLAMGLAFRWYAWPKLKTMEVSEALVPLMLFSALRHFGLCFLVPGVTGNLPKVFAERAGYGDFTVAVIALLAAISLRNRFPGAMVLAWAYGVLGLVDLVYGVALSNMLNATPEMGPILLIVVFLAPAVLISLIAILALLLQQRRITA